LVLGPGIKTFVFSVSTPGSDLTFFGVLHQPFKSTKIPETKLEESLNNGLKDGSIFSEDIPLIKEQALTRQNRILQYGTKDGPSLQNMVRRSMDDKLLDRRQIVKYGAKDGWSFKGNVRPSKGWSIPAHLAPSSLNYFGLSGT
ncbi:hypothetical protein HAX54_008597, partial [Datura stramonium]|nr:hypothetical protein [Datura stramonium]